MAQKKAAAKGAKKAAKPTPKGAAKKPVAKRPKKAAAKGEPGDWRDEVLARMRALIVAADPGIVEEVKWRKPSNPAGVPVWSRDGIICTGETYKDRVKLTFARGAALRDPVRLFNASLEGNARRAIDIREGESIDERAFQALVRDAAALNAIKRGKE